MKLKFISIDGTRIKSRIARQFKLISNAGSSIKAHIARCLHSPVSLWLGNVAWAVLGAAAWAILILDWMGKIHV